ncbi:hypothetical protein UlMin_020222, partial [Ulmus minor]
IIEMAQISNCIWLCARDLMICWGENECYWRWVQHRETCNQVIDIAELLNVCWLDVGGKIETTRLCPRTQYEVVFEIMMKDCATGWGVPVNVRLILPNGCKQECKVNLCEKPRGRWIEIPVGVFTTSPGHCGEIQFSLYEYGGHWKKGLVIKGVRIRPKH